MSQPQRTVQYPHVRVQLSGNDPNAFAIRGRVQRALQDSVGAQAALDWIAAADKCGSYDELLTLAMNTVDVA